MQSYSNKVAVITGGASGIGRGLAEKAVALGMRVVIADVDAGRLQAVAAELSAGGAEVLAQRTDVTQYESVQALAAAAFDRFGQVDLLFNNAGVLVDGLSWERSVEDWRWSLDVNVMGVVHGIKAFVPAMLKQDTEGVVVNTSSQAGLTVGQYLGPYTASKHAVLGITETLHYELQLLDAKLRAAVLCPGEVVTDIWHSERIRPDEHGSKPAFSTGDEARFRELVAGGVAQGMTPLQHADFVFDALSAGRFWLFPHPAFKDTFTRRYQSIIDETVPQVIRF
jgi:NAD(P)-dependent dehydrogenase (short-subunit alcohol dehydrogenase family)